ncbi:olfactory receptor 52K2-like [Pelobates fuscus]|uniref:olfactory receptor 52K2-like n=1 Tax=Pelobates fuscus TaxID=191477 RepID=UPI002FE4E086
MPLQNVSISHHVSFILLGVPGLEEFYVYIGLVFFVAYVISLMGNFTLLFIIKIEQSLHEPMYLFLCMLSSIDLVLSSSTIPKMISILWFNSQEIYYEACLTQMFFVHSFATMESSILLAMAFDRYLAICIPLRYTSLLTKQLVVYIGLGFLGRAVGAVLPLPILFKRLTLCKENIIHHAFCDHMAVVKLSCSDTTMNSLYGLVVALFIVALDLMLIILSYALILSAVFKLSTKESRLKALSTCASHICAILVFYVTVVLSSVVQRFGRNVPIYIHVLLASVYLILPPLINPIIYGVKTKQIQNRVMKLFVFKNREKVNDLGSSY